MLRRADAVRARFRDVSCDTLTAFFNGYASRFSSLFFFVSASPTPAIFHSTRSFSAELRNENALAQQEFAKKKAETKEKQRSINAELARLSRTEVRMRTVIRNDAENDERVRASLEGIRRREVLLSDSFI